MKKMIDIVLCLLLIVAMAVSAAAVTPKLDTPTVTVPDISDSVQKNLEEQYDFDYAVDSWLDEHPIAVDSTEPTEDTAEEPTEALKETHAESAYILNRFDWLNWFHKWR